MSFSLSQLILILQLFLLFTFLLLIAVLIMIWRGDGTWRKKLGWTLFVSSFPILAPLFYLLFRSDWDDTANDDGEAND